VKLSTPAKTLKMLGLRIAELRRARGWTQEHLAETLKVSPRYLQSVEGGKENLTVESLVGIAKALKVSLPDLFAVPADVERRVGRPAKRRPVVS
jgi:transcriptional regulator with XRE-family HTH domain